MKYKDNKIIGGFTLVEMMVVVAITVIIGGAMVRILLSGSSTWHVGEAQMQITQEARRGVSSMIRELRQTSSFQITGLPADNAYYNSVTFRIPQDNDGDGDVIDAFGNIEWSNTIQYYLGGVNNSQLLRTSGGATTVLANNVSGLSFRRQSISPDEVEVVLTTQKTTMEGRAIQITLNNKTKIRN